MSLPDPITRQDLFLASIAGEDVSLPDPITREELYLQAIAQAGGGASVPTPTAQDNGKFLGVSNGSYALVTLEDADEEAY